MSDRIWLQITSGRGPAECQLAVAKLADVLEKEARKAGLACEVLDVVDGRERGTALSALLSVEGEGARAFAANSRGSVLWICPSPVRPGHKRKNWFVGVELLAPPDAGNVVLRTADVVFEAMRASGPGGQHVNKTESA
ncbi:MAG TPA: peptide chain release factor H, partial [Hyphomicrobium sp.]|nr:peptide chain release factor H [Hyphomicrobium sp.]